MLNAKSERYFRNGMLVQLRVFNAVARHLNCTRAAESLNMAQPTVSLHLRKLSDTVGAPLLEFAGKRMQITEAGEKVLGAWQRTSQAFDDLDAAIENIRGLKTGRLCITTTTAGEYLVPPLLAEFVKRYPGIEPSLHVASRQALLSRLSEGLDDLYLLTNAPAITTVQAYPIFPNPLVALANSDHALAQQINVPFERFAQEPLLVREHGSATAFAVADQFAASALQPNVRMILGSNEAIKEAIVAGLGVSLMFRYACGFDLDKGLAVLDVPGLHRNSNWDVAYSHSTQLSRAAQTFVLFARTEARRIYEARLAGVAVSMLKSAADQRQRNPAAQAVTQTAQALSRRLGARNVVA